MKKIRLRDVVSFSKGQQINGDELMKNGRYDYLNGGINPSGCWNYFNVTGDTVTISEGGNSCGYVNYMSYPFWCGAHCYYLYDSKLNNKYLYYALKSQQEKIMKLRTGACMPNIKKTDLGKFELYITTDINAQELTVFILDKITDLIDKRKKQLEKLDELVKSRFIEMFGDMKINPNSYEIVKFEECVEYMGDIGSNGANSVVVEHLDMKDEEDYALMVRFLNFTKNDFTDDIKYVSKEAYDFFKKSQIFGGELIICKIGSAGQNYVMPYLNRPVSLGLNQIMVRINKKVLMPYLYQYLHTEYGQMLIDGCINGAVTKSITKTELKKIPIVLPPLELQNQFAAFVEQTGKSKFEIKQSLEKLELLKKALMQKYFG